MNGYERILATLTNQQADCLAFMPITMMFATDQIGTPYGKYALDHRVLVEAQLATAERFDIDHVSCISDPAREAADCGANIHFFDDQPPAVDEANALLLDKSRLRSLEVPKMEGAESRMADRIAAAALFAKEVKGKRWIEGWVEGPCAEASDLRGINNLMTDFIDDPAFVKELFSFCIEMATAFAKKQIEAGCDMIGIGDAAASLVGPRIYREFVLPFERQLVENIHQFGGKVRLHICGNIRRSLKDVGTLKCDMVDLDSMVPIAEAREAMGPEQVLAGNISPVNCLQKGTPEEIWAALTDCYKRAGDCVPGVPDVPGRSKKYIVGAGCEVPRDTPATNLREMCRFARENG